MKDTPTNHSDENPPESPTRTVRGWLGGSREPSGRSAAQPHGLYPAPMELPKELLNYMALMREHMELVCRNPRI